MNEYIPHRYKILAKIGEGVHGVVLKAVDTLENNKIVAIKKVSLRTKFGGWLNFNLEHEAFKLYFQSLQFNYFQAFPQTPFERSSRCNTLTANTWVELINVIQESSSVTIIDSSRSFRCLTCIPIYLGCLSSSTTCRTHSTRGSRTKKIPCRDSRFKPTWKCCCGAFLISTTTSKSCTG